MKPSTNISSSHGPSARLPIELLSEIFLLCVDDSVDARNTIHIPLLLSNICSHWRAAAIANPKLWARLFIELSGNASQDDIALVSTWLARSAACPLTIYVFWEEAPFGDTHAVLEKLMDHSERWRTMFFYLPYCAFKSFNRIRKRLPMLTDLSLGTDDDVAPDGLNMFEVAPSLRSLECVNFSPTVLRFPWSQLQDMPLLSGNIVDCLEVLARGTSLTKMSVVFVEGGPAVPGSQNTIYPYVCHKHLTCLTIMTPPWNESVELAALFPHLTLPHLETLTICNVNSTFGDAFTQFLARLPTLKTLHLRKTSLPDDQLVEGLKHLSSLTSLIVLSATPNARLAALHGADTAPELTVTRYLLEALTRNFFSNDAMDGMLLPRLQKLELTVSATAARELDTFVDMLQSRLRDDDGLARLEHVRVRPSVQLNDEFVIRLVELRDLGLDVQVESTDAEARI